MTRIAYALASILLLTGLSLHAARSNEVVEAGPLGVWINEKSTVAVRIERCGNALCGHIVWLAEPYQDNGELKRDLHNPNPEKRGQPICGLRIAKGFQQIDDHVWGGGTIYNPDEGESYQAYLSLIAPDKLRVHAYVFLPLFGKTVVMHRTAPPEQVCPHVPQVRHAQRP